MPISDAQKRARKKYNDKTYKDFRAPIRKEIFEEIHRWCEENGKSHADFIRMAWEIIKGGK